MNIGHAVRNFEEESPTVAALRGLSVFTADQSGAYREYFDEVSAVLGPDVDTKLCSFLSNWARSNERGTIILTGNAGTGKTAAAQTFCEAVGGQLPREDALVKVAPDARVVKDLSGLPLSRRASTLRSALDGAVARTLVCANEGVLRDSLEELGAHELLEVLEYSLRRGAASDGLTTIVNVNRQRPTSEHLWKKLLDYLTRAELWEGCSDCPFSAGGCSMRSNAEQLRRSEVRSQLRILFQLATGEAVPTLREVLAILSWALVGNSSCSDVKAAVRDLGASARSAIDGYFARAVGGGMSPEAAERSPLLAGIRSSGLGAVSDLEVDGWLRDASGATQVVRAIAGDPALSPEPGRTILAEGRGLAGTRSPLDRIMTKQRAMTFYALGEMVSTDEDPIRVEDGLEALVSGDGVDNAPAQALWRQRVFFEAGAEIGGATLSTRRLLRYRYIGELIELAEKVANGHDVVIELNNIVQGLNFLVTGFSSPNEGLVVPDPACLFARDPGAFRPAQPSFVHSLISISDLKLEVPDQGLVEEILDIDHIEIDLVVASSSKISLRVRPKMYEAIREAAEFGGPVGQGVAEMNDLRGFYGRLATIGIDSGASSALSYSLRVADPHVEPPAMVTVTLPHLLRSDA